MEKMIPKRLSNKGVKKPRIKFNPVLALIGLRTTGPRTVNIINEGGDKIWEFLQLDSKRQIEKLEKTPTVIRCNNKLTM